MMDFNFLTEEYKLKLHLENLAKGLIVILLAIMSIEFSVSTGLAFKINKQNQEIGLINNKIKGFDKKSQDLKVQREKIPDLTNEISIVEELVSQKTLKYSEVLYLIQENTPNKVWFTSLTYDKNKVFLQGFAAKDTREKISSDLNVFLLEKRLKNTNAFLDVKVEYMKNAIKKGNSVKEFKYTLTLK